MAKSNISEVEFQLRKLLVKYSDLFAYHQWPSEHERWIELLFALVTRICRKPETEVRDVIEELDDLGLLDVEELSEIPAAGGHIDFNSTNARHLIQVLSESGFTKEESRNTVLVMHEASTSLERHHDGKIQKYIRKYGQRMIDELSENFSFSKMRKHDVELAFTYWLQNVLNMPVNLKTKSTDAFCERFKVTDEKLVREADRMDVNLALLDDMILNWLVQEKKQQKDKTS